MLLKLIARLALVLAVVGLTPAARAQFAATGSTNVSVSVGAEASISVNGASPLTTSGTLFSDYTGTTTFTYKMRTTKTGGSGSITANVSTDFSPTGGPSVVTPPAAGDTLKYGCTVAAPATACSGSITAATSATNVATFGANARSDKAGNSGSLAWVLTNDPVYQTGDYTAVVTLSVSSL